MYSLDVNFLKDRGLDSSSKKGSYLPKKQEPIETKVPLFIGGALLAILPLLSLGYLMLANNQKAQLESEIKQKDAEISQLQAQNTRLVELQTQLEQQKAELNALVSVFNQIKPFSVILEDLKDLMPKGVKISSIEQSEIAPVQGANEQPKQQLIINGIASSANEVNDFLLLLQSSDFLNGQKTAIQTAELVDSPVQLASEQQLEDLARAVREGRRPLLPPELQQNSNNEAQASQPQNLEEQFDIPQVVQFSIRTELGDRPASELLPELASKGAVGLVTRIRTLEQKGAIQR